MNDGNGVAPKAGCGNDESRVPIKMDKINIKPMPTKPIMAKNLVHFLVFAK